MVSSVAAGAAAPFGAKAVGRRLALTLGALIVYRLGAAVPLSGLAPQIAAGSSRPLLFTTERLSIFALGVEPILGALITFELLKLIFPSLDAWSNRDVARRAGARRYVLGLALFVALLQASALTAAFERVPSFVVMPGAAFRLTVMTTLVGATTSLAWLGERITRHGLGAGFWLLLLAPGLDRLGRYFVVTVYYWGRGIPPASSLLVELAFTVAALALVALALEIQELDGRDWGRACDGFAIVWTPLIATVIANAIVAFLRAEFASAVVTGAYSTPLRILLVGALIVVLAWRRRAFDAGEPGSRVRRLAIIAIQLAVTLGAMLTARGPPLPIVVDGPMLFVVGATVTNLRRSVRRALAGGAAARAVLETLAR